MNSKKKIRNLCFLKNQRLEKKKKERNKKKSLRIDFSVVNPAP